MGKRKEPSPEEQDRLDRERYAQQREERLDEVITRRELLRVLDEVIEHRTDHTSLLCDLRKELE